MNVSNVVIQDSVKALEGQNTHQAYLVNAEGKEVQITTAMVTTVCHQLLKQCRNIKN
ncbi:MULTISPECIES: PA1571 family protein [unclassified Acinetobacter]|uniref:PA1571 family protein n=1 Tax=unclassified Acinetobacter TaxID=196816 RepID=UPI00293423DC|nr:MULTISPECIES: PA1571 family protein [unclassified Acinetobacter]WOE33102.1 hypothetical protein QSG84_06385 [Acinetobacter sp. SAAs470]WOE39928.1 hypothetical protein QSG86_15440 [Acinetobacter sp. SAAs474]